MRGTVKQIICDKTRLVITSKVKRFNDKGDVIDAEVLVTPFSRKDLNYRPKRTKTLYDVD